MLKNKLNEISEKALDKRDKFLKYSDLAMDIIESINIVAEKGIKHFKIEGILPQDVEEELMAEGLNILKYMHKSVYYTVVDWME